MPLSLMAPCCPGSWEGRDGEEAPEAMCDMLDECREHCLLNVGAGQKPAVSTRGCREAHLEAARTVVQTSSRSLSTFTGHHPHVRPWVAWALPSGRSLFIKWLQK